MAFDFGNLSKLYIAKQRLLQYNSNNEAERAKADVNEDGKVDEDDLTLISRDIRNAQTVDQNAFDFNHDGKVNEKDWDFFQKFLENESMKDLDNDDVESVEEQAFFAEQEKNLKKAVLEQLKKDKFTGTFDGLIFSKGQKFSGTYTDGKVYKDGVLCTGVYNGRLYKDGVLNKEATTFNNKLYVNGVLFSGTHTDGKVYKDGVAFTGLKNDEYYEEGVKPQGFKEYEGKLYNNGVLYTDAKDVNGHLYKDGKLFTGLDNGKFYVQGAVYSGDVRTDYPMQDGSVTSVIYKYGADGQLANGLVDGLMYQNGFLFTGTKDGKTYQFGVNVSDDKAANPQNAISDGTVSSETKDDNGRVTSFTKTVGTGSSALVYTVTITYNTDGSIATRTETDNATQAKTEYTNIVTNGDCKWISYTETKKIKTDDENDPYKVESSYKITVSYNADGTVVRKETNLLTGDVTIYNLDSNGKVTSSNTTTSKGTVLERTYTNGACSGRTITKVNNQYYTTETVGNVTYTVITEAISDGGSKKTYVAPNGTVFVQILDKDDLTTSKLTINSDGSTLEETYKSGILNGSYAIAQNGTKTSMVYGKDSNDNIIIVSKRVETDTTITYTYGDETNKLVYDKETGVVTKTGSTTPIVSETEAAEINSQVDKLVADLYEQITILVQPKIYKDISQGIMDAINEAVKDYMNEQTDSLLNKIALIMSNNKDLAYAGTMILTESAKKTNFAQNISAIEDSLEQLRLQRYGRDNASVKDSFNFEAKAITGSTEFGYTAVDVTTYKAGSSSQTDADEKNYDAVKTQFVNFVGEISTKINELVAPINAYIEGLTNQAYYLKIGDEYVTINAEDFTKDPVKYCVHNANGEKVNVNANNLMDALKQNGARIVTKEFSDTWNQNYYGKTSVDPDVYTKITISFFGSSYFLVNSNGEDIASFDSDTLKSVLDTPGNRIVTADLMSAWEKANEEKEEAQATINSLRGQINSTNSSNSSIQSQINANEATIETLRTSLASETDADKQLEIQSQIDDLIAKNNSLSQQIGDTSSLQTQLNEANAKLAANTYANFDAFVTAYKNKHYQQGVIVYGPNFDAAVKDSADSEIKFELKANTEDDAAVIAAFNDATQGKLEQIAEMASSLKTIMNRMTSLRQSLIAAGFSEASLNNSSVYITAINKAKSEYESLIAVLEESVKKLEGEKKTDLETQIKNLREQLSSINELSSSVHKTNGDTYKPKKNYGEFSENFYDSLLSHSDKQVFRKVIVNGIVKYYLKDNISKTEYNNLSDIMKAYFVSEQQDASKTQKEDEE